MTAVNQRGRFRIPGVTPGDPAHSAVLYRMSTRNPFRQMPPLDMKFADADAVNQIQRWIQEDLIKGENYPRLGMNDISIK
jgi:hypothetical protein